MNYRQVEVESGKVCMQAPTVLLVEDNQLLRWWLTRSLQREGYSVVAPKSVEEVVQMTGSPFDVLITDWRLPDGHDGFQVLRRLRAKCSGILAILISAEADAELADRARASGFDVVIQKPFPLAEIMGAVHGLAASQHSEVRL
jgi:CheY-like chemotaxis protein